MEKLLKNKVVLVTGAASGIGKGICDLFYKRGAKILATDLEMPKVRGYKCYDMDLASETSVQTVTRQILKEQKNIDILVNCAGIFQKASWQDYPALEDWNKVLKVNLTGSFLICRELFDHFSTRGSGNIILIGSASVKRGSQFVSPQYLTSKAGVHGLAINLANALVPYNVRVNCIAPGLIATPMTDNPYHQKLQELIPLGGQMGHVDDVANAALFLASPQAAFITGEILDVNGGTFND